MAARDRVECGKESSRIKVEGTICVMWLRKKKRKNLSQDGRPLVSHPEPQDYEANVLQNWATAARCNADSF